MNVDSEFISCLFASVMSSNDSLLVLIKTQDQKLKTRTNRKVVRRKILQNSSWMLKNIRATKGYNKQNISKLGKKGKSNILQKSS